MADPLAVALLAGSTWFMLLHLRQRTRSTLAASAVLGLAGGLTQAYAGIPFAVGALVRAGSQRRSIQQMLRASMPVVLFLVSLVALKLAWRAAVPHQDVTLQFSFLRLSLDMARFYAHVWSLTYLPLLPILIACVISWWVRRQSLSIEVVFLASTVIVFGVLTFLYQWAEARLTFIYQPLILLLFMTSVPTQTATVATGRARRWCSVAAVCAAALVAFSLTVIPLTYYGYPHVAWAPKLSWVVQAWSARPVDRFGLGTLRASHSYADATMPDVGAYTRRILSKYLALRVGRERSSNDRPFASGQGVLPPCDR